MQKIINTICTSTNHQKLVVAFNELRRLAELIDGEYVTKEVLQKLGFEFDGYDGVFVLYTNEGLNFTITCSPCDDENSGVEFFECYYNGTPIDNALELVNAMQRNSL